MRSRTNAILWALGAVLTTFLCGARLPLWTYWSVSLSKYSTRPCSLPGVFLSVLSNQDRFDSSWEILSLHRGNALVAFALIAVGIVIGWLVYRCLREHSGSWGSTAGGVGVLAAAVGMMLSTNLGAELAIAWLIATCYVLAVGYEFFQEDELLVESGPVLDVLLPLKAQGKLLARGRNRVRRKHRTSVMPDVPEDEPDELTRLLKVKRNVFPAEPPTAEPVEPNPTTP